MVVVEKFSKLAKESSDFARILSENEDVISID